MKMRIDEVVRGVRVVASAKIWISCAFVALNVQFAISSKWSEKII